MEKVFVNTDESIDNFSLEINKLNSETAMKENKNLIEMFESVEPQEIAIENEKVSLTYKEFNERVNQLAHFLIQKGLGPKNGAVVCLDDPIEHITATLAVLKTGAYFIPLDCNDPEEYRLGIIEDVKPHLVIEEILNDSLISLPKNNPRVKIPPNNLAYIIYTSGSTGAPKGVMIEHGGLGHRVLECAKFLNITSRSRVLFQSSLSFDMHITEWSIAFANGATLCPIRRETKQLWRFLNQMRATHVLLTPGVLSLFPEKRPTNLQYICVGGEATPQYLMERWSKYATVVNGYGPSECTMITHMHVFNSGHPSRIIGRSLPGVKSTVLDSSGKIVQEGGIGELHIGGIGVTRGYVGEDIFKKRQYKTGDLVRVLPNGLFEFVSRKNDSIKVSGCRVDPHLIANKVSEIQSVDEVVIVPIRVNGEKRVLGCYYTGTPINPRIIRQYLRRKLPSYMIPTCYYHLREIPRLSNGKVDYKRLVTIKGESRCSTGGVMNELEKELAEIWSKILEEGPKEKESDFFQMGGDSLQSIKLLMEIEKKWEIGMHFSELQDHSTLSRLAQLINLQQKKRREQSIISIQTTGDRTPLFLVHPSVGIADCYRPPIGISTKTASIWTSKSICC